jgi:uncharacterized repeat protein (TIGR03803 family)
MEKHAGMRIAYKFNIMKTFILFYSISLFSVVITPAQTLTTLVWFDDNFNGTNGANPECTLIQANDGNFYGTTLGGEVIDEYETIFKMTPDGSLTTLAAFNWFTGPVPPAGFMQASDGNLYGFGEFSIVKMAPDGTVKYWFTFNNSDWTNFNIGTNWGSPLAMPVQGNDGNLYGMAPGGLYNRGAIFRLTTNGALTVIANFFGGNGAYNAPYGGLVQGKDGNFYGAVGEGAYYEGAIIRVTTNGTLTTLVNFNGTNGVFPYGGLMQASDGNFYGTTYGNGGTVFRMTPDGMLTTLVRSPSTAGFPKTRLLQASDGNLYGTTRSSVFKITLGGILTTLVTNIGSGQSGLVEGKDGNLYGTTEGGYYGGGTVFKISGLDLLPRFQSVILTNGSVNLSWNSVSNWTYRVQYKTSLTDTNWTDLPGDVMATNVISSKTDVAVPTQCFYRLLLLR